MVEEKRREERLSLVDKTREFESSLRNTKRRWYYLRAMSAELERCTRGKPIRIFNDIAWQMLGDSYSMLVVDLASWIRRQSERGGLFGLMKATLHELPRKFPKRRRREHFEHPDALRAWDEEVHEKAITDLFPASSGRLVQAADVDALAERLRVESDALIRDRNANRAHSHELPQGTAEPISLDAVGKLCERLEEALNLVRLIADWSTTSFDDMKDADAEDTAKELVDMILIGLRYRRQLVTQDPATQRDEFSEDGPTLERDDYYARLHAIHEADTAATEKKAWNEYMLRDTITPPPAS